MTNDSVRSDKELTLQEEALKDVRGSYEETYGFSSPDNYTFKSQRGLNPDVVRQISMMKNEPEWMTAYRLKAYEIFISKPMPQWGGNLNDIDFDNIFYFVRASDRQGRNWDEVPPEIKHKVT